MQGMLRVPAFGSLRRNGPVNIANRPKFWYVVGHQQQMNAERGMQNAERGRRNDERGVLAKIGYLGSFSVQ